MAGLLISEVRKQSEVNGGAHCLLRIQPRNGVTPVQERPFGDVPTVKPKVCL